MQHERGFNHQTNKFIFWLIVEDHAFLSSLWKSITRGGIIERDQILLRNLSLLTSTVKEI